MHVWRILTLIVGVSFMALAGCGATSTEPELPPGTLSSTPPPLGDAEQGRELFVNTLALTGSPNCSSCHVVEAGEIEIVGPSLVGIATIASQRDPNLTAEEYLYRSLVVPNEYIVAGYNAGIMPRTYGLYLSREQIGHLLAYMLTLD